MNKLTRSQSFFAGALVTVIAVGAFRSQIMKPRTIQVSTPQVIVNEVSETQPNFSEEAELINSSLNQSKLRHLLVYIHGLSKYYEVDYELIKAVITTESSWDHKAKSSSNARGLMQLKPSTAYQVFKTPADQLYDPYVNVTLGIMYLAHLRDHHGFDSLPEKLTAYSHGPTVTKTYSENYIFSNPYVQTVFSHQKES
jgi:soluble lytic murein transglycosylase-like protein